ncbi:hypothetical protein VPH35_132140 [Triticum aestivum]
MLPPVPPHAVVGSGRLHAATSLPKPIATPNHGLLLPFLGRRQAGSLDRRAPATSSFGPLVPVAVRQHDDMRPVGALVQFRCRWSQDLPTDPTLSPSTSPILLGV